MEISLILFITLMIAAPNLCCNAPGDGRAELFSHLKGIFPNEFRNEVLEKAKVEFGLGELRMQEYKEEEKSFDVKDFADKMRENRKALQNIVDEIREFKRRIKQIPDEE